MYLSVSSNEPVIKSETYGVMWHVAPESKIQLVNSELSPKFPLGHSSLSDIYVIDAYISWSLLFSPLSHAKKLFHESVLAFAIFHYILVALDILQLGDPQICI